MVLSQLKVTKHRQHLRRKAASKQAYHADPEKNKFSSKEVYHADPEKGTAY